MCGDRSHSGPVAPPRTIRPSASNGEAVLNWDLTSMQPQLTQVLRKSSLFGGLSDAELELLAALSSRRSFGQGEILFLEGMPCLGLYIILTGKVRIFKTSPSGREQVLTVERPGGTIAELPVFDGGVYPASAAAVEESETVFISRDGLRSVCLEHPEVSLKLLQVAGARLRRLVGIIEELSFTTVRHRLVAYLLRQSETSGSSFTLDTSHQELAAQLGTVRELVSRNLARLQAQGLVELKGREVQILDKPGLEAELSNG